MQNSGGQSRWYVAHLPVIRLNADGSVAGVRLNERQISSFDVDADLVGRCYSALRRLFNILYDPELARMLHEGNENQGKYGKQC